MSQTKQKKTLLKSPTTHLNGSSALNGQVSCTWYTTQKIQPLDYAMDNNLNPCQAKVVKYVSRYNLKHKTIKDQIKDLEKAKHVIDILIEKIQEK